MANLKAKASVKAVNELLAAQGRGESLRRSPSGYYYFEGGRTAYWPLTSIYVYRISEMTLGAVMGERDRLAADELDGTGETF